MLLVATDVRIKPNRGTLKRFAAWTSNYMCQPDRGHPVERPHASEWLHPQRSARRRLLLGTRRHWGGACQTRSAASHPLARVQTGGLRVLPQPHGKPGEGCLREHDRKDVAGDVGLFGVFRCWPYFQPPTTTRWAATEAPTSGWATTLCRTLFSIKPARRAESSRWGKGTIEAPRSKNRLCKLEAAARFSYQNCRHNQHQLDREISSAGSKGAAVCTPVRPHRRLPGLWQ